MIRKCTPRNRFEAGTKMFSKVLWTLNLLAQYRARCACITFLINPNWALETVATIGGLAKVYIGCRRWLWVSVIGPRLTQHPARVAAHERGGTLPKPWKVSNDAAHAGCCPGVPGPTAMSTTRPSVK
jgi:hypothetical protein